MEQHKDDKLSFYFDGFRDEWNQFPQKLFNLIYFFGVYINMTFHVQSLQLQDRKGNAEKVYSLEASLKEGQSEGICMQCNWNLHQCGV